VRALVVSLAAALVAAPAASAKLTPREEAWVRPVLVLVNAAAKDVRTLPQQVGDPAALTVGTKQNLALTLTLSRLVSCTPRLKRLGAPPTARLRPAASSLAAACTYLGSAGHLFARWIGSLRSAPKATSKDLLARAAAQFGLGKTALLQARSRLVALG
jgi:hypothetical protein